MALADVWTWLENTALAQHIGATAWFPFIESLHVLAVVFVVGSILMVDLRLLNLAARSYAFGRMSRELVPWTWVAFAVASVTGIGLLSTRASVYMENPALQIKLVLLALAGANMAFFQFGAYRRVAGWDAPGPPASAKIAGAASLMLWSGAMLAGRWIGHLV